jgi:2-haloacid dehalogenase
MLIDRRTLLQVSAAAGALAVSRSARAAAPARIKALAFDGLAVLDPRPIGAIAERLYPGRGAELITAWRTRQFEYTWLRSMTRRYADFWTVTEEALAFAANLLKLELGAEQRGLLMQGFLELKAWPDAVPALRLMQASGLRLALLTNFSPRMIEASSRGAGLDGLFEFSLSTDQVQVYKPDPRAYQMGVDAFRLERDEILFVAFGGWDAAGAKAFGYPTFWANRLGLPVEELGVRPDAIGKDLADLARYVAGQ